MNPSTTDEILQGLDPEQREVATSLVGPMCVLAGAGTGKTRAITHRIAYGVRTGTYAAANVLAVTFTARAAGEMRSRLRDLGVVGVSARTFHAAALRQLSYFLPKVERRQVPKLLNHKASVVAQAAARLGLEVDRAMVRDLAAEIEWAKVNMLTADEYRQRSSRMGRGEVAGLDSTAVSRLIALYEQILGELDAMDFEDVMLILLGLFQEHPHVADEVRRQYRYFVVDEYQDVSPLADALLRAWLGRSQQVCVVGDPNQTIYSFTGASDRYLLGFTRTYPKAKVVKLVRDYRSTPQVVSLANSVLRTSRSAGVELVAQRPSGPAPRFTQYSDDDDEASGVAQRIAALTAQGVPAGDIAVLYRTNSQSEPLEQALAHAGIAYLVRGGERFFSRAEVREAMVLIRGAAVGQTHATVADQLRAVLSTLGWSPQPPSQRGQVRERWESLQALISLGDELVSSGVATTMRDVAAELELRAQEQNAPSFGGVTLASLHAAKGLEWQAVFLVGLADGLLPISLAQGPGEVDEERRLLYVGVTRAREHLELSYAKARTPGGKATRAVSRFLTGLWPQPERPGRGTSPTLTPQRQQLLDALMTWRAGVAQRVDRPEFSVVHDRSLQEVALRLPATTRDLLGIAGLGQVKVQAYGAELLAVVSDWKKNSPE